MLKIEHIGSQHQCQTQRCRAELVKTSSRMRTERSPNSLAFVHTLCTARKEKSTYIRLYKMFCHPNDLSRSQVWSPSRGFSR